MNDFFACCCLAVRPSRSLPLERQTRDIREGRVTLTLDGSAVFNVPISALPAEIGPEHHPQLPVPVLARRDLSNVKAEMPPGWTLYLCGDWSGYHGFTAWTDGR